MIKFGIYHPSKKIFTFPVNIVNLNATHDCLNAFQDSMFGTLRLLFLTWMFLLFLLFLQRVTYSKNHKTLEPWRLATQQKPCAREPENKEFYHIPATRILVPCWSHASLLLVHLELGKWSLSVVGVATAVHDLRLIQTYKPQAD